MISIPVSTESGGNWTSSHFRSRYRSVRTADIYCNIDVHYIGDSMSLKTNLKKLIETTGYTIKKSNGVEHLYDRDGLRSVHNHDFMRDPAFIAAYARGVQAAGDLDWHWRVHVGLWAAYSASKLDGDFVECGVNRGFLSSAIMQYLDWDKTGKIFYLLDTFTGLDERYVSATEIDSGTLVNNETNLATGHYVSGVDSVEENFAEWNNLKIIKGSIPDTLPGIKAKQIAYLHLDMNCAPPEVSAFEYLWDRLVNGAFVLLDDYAYQGYREQKYAMDKAANAKGHKIVSLPTGQGLIIRS